jgi:hypothetical protein
MCPQLNPLKAPVENSMNSSRRCFDHSMRLRTLLVLVAHGRFRRKLP